MVMIRSIIRPEKVDSVLAALMEAGYPAVTKVSVVGVKATWNKNR